MASKRNEVSRILNSLSEIFGKYKIKFNQPLLSYNIKKPYIKIISNPFSVALSFLYVKCIKPERIKCAWAWSKHNHTGIWTTLELYGGSCEPSVDYNTNLKLVQWNRNIIHLIRNWHVKNEISVFHYLVCLNDGRTISDKSWYLDLEIQMRIYNHP